MEDQEIDVKIATIQVELPSKLLGKLLAQAEISKSSVNDYLIAVLEAGGQVLQQESDGRVTIFMDPVDDENRITREDLLEAEQ